MLFLDFIKKKIDKFQFIKQRSHAPFRFSYPALRNLLPVFRKKQEGCFCIPLVFLWTWLEQSNATVLWTAACDGLTE